MYHYNPKTGFFITGPGLDRLQITVREVHSGKMQSFIITKKNKFFAKFWNAKSTIIFEGTISNRMGGSLTSFKDVTLMHPEYVI